MSSFSNSDTAIAPAPGRMGTIKYQSMSVQAGDVSAELTPSFQWHDWGTTLMEFMSDRCSLSFLPSLGIVFRDEQSVGRLTCPVVQSYGVTSLDRHKLVGEQLELLRIVFDRSDGGKVSFRGDRLDPESVTLTKVRVELTLAIMEACGEITHGVKRMSDVLASVTVNMRPFSIEATE